MVEANLKSVWWPDNSEGDPAPPLPRIHFYERFYRGSEADLVVLQSTLPELQKEFPSHSIYADGSEIIGALAKDLTPGTPIYRQIMKELTGKLEDRGISFFNCAIITTGGSDRLSICTF